MKNIRYWGNQALPGGVKKGAKWGQNAIIDNFTTVMPYIRFKLNKIVTYPHYRYTWTVVKWKIFVTGVIKHFQGIKNGANWGQNAIYRPLH